MNKEILDEVNVLQKMKTEYDTACENLIEKLFRLLHDPVRHVFETNPEELAKYPETATVPWSEGLVFSGFDIETYTFRKEAKPWVLSPYLKESEANDGSLQKMVAFINKLWDGIARFEARYIDKGRQFEIKVTFIQ